MNTKPGRKANIKTIGVLRAPQLHEAALAITPVAPASAPRRRAAKVRTPIVTPVPVAAVGTSKQARLIAMLRALPGATIEEMMTLTGWQAHTVRGTISGVLRKKLGLNVTCAVRDGSGRSLYRIVGAAVAA